MRLERQAGNPTVSQLSNLATLSRTFQRAVDAFLFSSLQTDSVDLDEFGRAVTGPRRWHLNKVILVVTVVKSPIHSRRTWEKSLQQSVCRLPRSLVC